MIISFFPPAGDGHSVDGGEHDGVVGEGDGVLIYPATVIPVGCRNEFQCTVDTPIEREWVL